jgi:L-threonylcarbamoyladenylate synthase
MRLIVDVKDARLAIKQGEVIAYPTEAVYGLGCCPFNKEAVFRIQALKARSSRKGFIILIANWAQLTPLITPISDELMQPVRETWPGPVSWIFPKSPQIPDWLTGEHEGIAIRMSAHPLLQALCLDGPVVSTSANLSGEKPIVALAPLIEDFSSVDGVLLGELGGLSQPSQIIDVRTGTVLR